MTLKTDTVVDATLIAASSSTRNAKNDPEMHQTRKSQHWHFSRKLRIGADSLTGLAHSATVTAPNMHDKNALSHLLHGREQRVYGNNAYASQKELICSKAPQAKDYTNERVRRRKDAPADEAKRAKNRNKSKIRARVKHVFAVIKRLWVFGKVRYRGLAKHAGRAFTALTPAKIYLSRHRLMEQVRT